MASYDKYYVCKNIKLLEWLQDRGHIHQAAIPVEGKHDKWTYIFENNPHLEEDINIYFRNQLWKRGNRTDEH